MNPRIRERQRLAAANRPPIVVAQPVRPVAPKGKPWTASRCRAAATRVRAVRDAAGTGR